MAKEPENVQLHKRDIHQSDDLNVIMPPTNENIWWRLGLTVPERLTVLLFRWVGIIALCGAVYLLMKQLNDLTGYAADDYLYHFFFTGEWPAKHLRSINSLGSLLASIQIHTRINNGRFVAHTFVQLLMQFPKSVYNVLNSLVYVMLALLINIHVFGSIKRLRLGYLAATFALMWIVLPDFGTSILWLSGGPNYLWMALIYLTFLLPYRLHYQTKHPRIMFGVMLVLGFLAGGTNENSAPLTLFVALAFTLLDGRERGQNGWRWAGGLAGALSFMILVVSGSRQVAKRGANQFAFNTILRFTWRYSGVILLTGLIVMFYLYGVHHSWGREFNWREHRTFLAGCLYWLGGCLGIVALLVSPEIVSRNFFGPNVYFITALLLFVYEHAQLRGLSLLTQLLPFVFAIIVLWVSIPTYNAAINSLAISYRYFKAGTTICREDARKGVSSAKIPGIPVVADTHNVYLSQTYAADGRPTKQWFNVWMAAYYGLKSVTIDNSLPVPALKVNREAPAYRLQNGLTNMRRRLSTVGRILPVHAATQMETAYLNYVDQNGHVVGTEPISGVVGTTFNISHASVAGYRTTPGNPQAYTFDGRSNQVIVIHVVSAPHSVSAQIIYRNKVNGEVVGREPIAGATGSTFNITHAARVGFDTLTRNPKHYTFNSSAHQIVTVWVRPTVHNAILYYMAGKHKVGKQAIQVRTGDSIKMMPPFGFAIPQHDAKYVHMSARGFATRQVKVVAIPLFKRLWTNVTFKLIFFGSLLFILWDQLLAYYQFKNKRFWAFEPDARKQQLLSLLAAKRE